MGQHKLNLSEEKRIAARKRFNELKRISIPKPTLYLDIKNSRAGFGRNKAKRAK